MSAVLESSVWTTSHALDYLAATRAMRIQTEVREVEWLARLDSDLNPYGHSIDSELDRHFVVEDVACALNVASVVAAAKLHVAGQLVTRFAATLEAMRETRIDLRCATKLVELTEHLPDGRLAQLEADALTNVETKTLGQFTARLRRLVAAADPRAAEVKHQADRAERRVMFTPVENGMTELWALLPAEEAASLEATIHRLAKRGATVGSPQAPADDDRSGDQRRADALCSLATGGQGLRPRIHVTVPAAVLLGLDDQPAELDTHSGPVALTAAVARRIAADATGTWRRILTDRAGNVCDVTSRRYRPPAPIRHAVQLRDRTCRFPTCRRRATRCEIDHVRAWADGGPTTASNLIPLCSRHHHLKHDGRWRVRRERDGTVAWTTPTGRTYRVPPPDPLPHS